MSNNESLNYNSGNLYVTASDIGGYYKPQGTTSPSNWYGTIDELSIKTDASAIKSNWDYGITLNEDAIKEIVEKITKKRELDKITLNDGPEIPKWTGFLEIKKIDNE